VATHDPSVRRATTHDLTRDEVAALRALLWSAFPPGDDEGFDEADWQHAIGGMHFLIEVEGRLVAHASVVERDLHVDGRHYRTGYVEAVATEPARQGQGLGSLVMQDATDHIRGQFELGALGTGRHTFYERLGWQTWLGPAYVRTAGGPVRTPFDEGYILVLLTPRSAELDLTGAISCEWRPGDVW
jgi:aminoglycoside 2'-N-acetyltransferase I